MELGRNKPENSEKAVVGVRVIATTERGTVGGMGSIGSVSMAIGGGATGGWSNRLWYWCNSDCRVKVLSKHSTNTPMRQGMNFESRALGKCRRCCNVIWKTASGVGGNEAVSGRCFW
jgi:hypothetical protein